MIRVEFQFSLIHDVPKELMFDIMKEMNQVEMKAPVHRGDVVEANICGSGADLVITKDVSQA